MKNDVTIVFVHGAFSTGRAFNYFKTKFQEYQQLSFTYDWNDSPIVVGKQLAEFISTNVKTTNIILMGHSLGGNVSIHSLPNMPAGIKVSKVFTYGSPLGGSPHALLIGMFSSESVFGHLRPTSMEIRTLKKIASANRQTITSFVTTKGPLSDANDGVVTVKSQTAINGLPYIKVATNHMEVLLCDAVIDSTRKLIET